jgi:hypothetical protein
MAQDQPLVDVSAGTFAAATGVYGAVRGALAAAGRALLGNAVTAGAEQTAAPSAGMLRQFGRQLEEHGRGSVEKSIRRLEGRLTEHLGKLEEIRARGGDPGSVVREISNFRR